MDHGQEFNFKQFPLPEVLIGCHKKPKNSNLNLKNKVLLFLSEIPICAYRIQNRAMERTDPKKSSI